MNDFQKNVHRKEPTPYEDIRITPIEKDKKGKEEGYKELPPTSAKPLVFGSLVTFFKKFLSVFFGKEKPASSLLDQQQMLEDVAAFRKLLQILSKEDQSHNPEFTQQLSELWHHLVDDYSLLTASSHSIPSYLSKLMTFINEVHHFPPDEDHSLGYYFTEYAGKDWIPFPFMEILEGLYREYIQSPQTSTLSRWLSELTDVLASSGYQEFLSDS
jgi:hypothetical protein